MNKQVRIGILGCGPRGMQMAWITNLLPDCCVLTAMSDPDENALQKAKEAFPGIAFYASSDALLDSGKVDAVITEVPPAIHTEYVVKALERNIHVLAEIPAADSIEEGDLLWKKVNSSRAMYMCGSTPNYRSKTLLAKKIQDLGLLGKIAYAESEYIHDLTRSNDAWRSTYESCRYCTHSLAPVLELKNEELVSVSCMSTYNQLNNNSSHNAMCAMYRTKSNFVVRVLTAFGLPYKGAPHTTRIFAEKGYAILQNDKLQIYLHELGDYVTNNKPLEIELTPKGTDKPANMKIVDEKLFLKGECGHNGSDNLMLKDFITAIEGNKESPISIKDALKLTLPGIYAAESAKEGGALKEIRYPWN